MTGQEYDIHRLAPRERITCLLINLKLDLTLVGEDLVHLAEAVRDEAGEWVAKHIYG
jgi:hypothetical protein